jgi:5'-3' exonuclease
MGIKGFSDFLKRYASGCYFEVPLESFRGKRLAIDMHMMIYEAMFGATAEVVESTNLRVCKPNPEEINTNTLNRVLAKLITLMTYGIVPVCVFDGKPHPLKQLTQSARTSKKEKTLAKIQESEDKLYAVESLLRTDPLVNDYKKAYKAHIDPGREFYAQIKDVLISSGFPVLMAEDFKLNTNDAEAICAALCLPSNGYCAASVTGDSDYHTYGGDLAIIDYYAKYQTINGERVITHYAKVRCLESILDQTGLTFDMFRDLCILMGTDFNPNIHLVGPVKSWNYIRQYGSIANLSQVIDVSVLNYNEVLSIFMASVVRLELSNLDFNIAQFRDCGREVFDQYGLHTQIDRLMQCVHFCEDASVATL